MKLRKIFYACLCGLALTAFTACSDDDDENDNTVEWNATELGSKVEMSQTRAFILNEGSYGANNAHLTYFDYSTHSVYGSDIYYVQNGVNIGDTGQDLIEYNGNLYMAVYNSNYITKLNGVGIEQGRISFNDYPELGQIRYMVAVNGYIYVTSYGGYVNKVDAETLDLIGSVQVGDNPEQITECDGYLYCMNSGWGYDNRLSIINESTFDTAENVEIFLDPEKIINVDGTIVLQGYGGYYPDYTYPVAIYNKSSKTYEQIGVGTDIAGYNGIIYIVNSDVNYMTTPYTGTTEIYSYNIKTGAIDNSVLDIPEELANLSTYGISINPNTGYVYVLATNFTWGDGTVYYFDNNGNYLGKFSSGGQNPSKIVFLND